MKSDAVARGQHDALWLKRHRRPHEDRRVHEGVARFTGGAIDAFDDALRQHGRVVDDRCFGGDSRKRRIEHGVDARIVAQTEMNAVGAASGLDGIGESDRAVRLRAPSLFPACDSKRRTVMPRSSIAAYHCRSRASRLRRMLTASHVTWPEPAPREQIEPRDDHRGGESVPNLDGVGEKLQIECVVQRVFSITGERYGERRRDIRSVELPTAVRCEVSIGSSAPNRSQRA